MHRARAAPDSFCGEVTRRVRIVWFGLAAVLVIAGTPGGGGREAGGRDELSPASLGGYIQRFAPAAQKPLQQQALASPLVALLHTPCPQVVPEGLAPDLVQLAQTPCELQ